MSSKLYIGRWARRAFLAGAIGAITLSASPAASQQSWSVEPVLTIGSFDGDIAFGSISGIAVRASGEILVLDRLESTVMVFDASGELIGQFGGAGAGPGELSEAAVGLYATPDGGVMVPDLMNGRISFFDAAGEHAGGFRIDPLAGMPVKWAVRDDGTLMEEVRPLPLPPGMPGRGGPTEHSIVLLDADGSHLSTFTTFDLPSMVEFEPGGTIRSHVFAENPIWALMPDGNVVIGRSGLYRLEVRDAAGSVVGEIARDVRRAPVTDEIREEYTRRMEEQFAEMDMPPQALAMMGDPIFADSLPLIIDVRPGPGGTLLVARGQGLMDRHAPNGVPDLEDAIAVFDVHTLDGRWLGVLQLPARTNLQAIHGDLVYAIARDEYDVETVVVFRVAPPG